MQAMILAAGRGDRMRPLTDKVPKPLLRVAGKALIEYHIERLTQAGVQRLVINHAHLGEQIPQVLGDGARWGISIDYLPEPEGALETGGGIFNALPLLGGEPFIVVNADIWTDYPFRSLPVEPNASAHLVLVDNPAQHPQGDFALADGTIRESGAQQLTFSGIGMYRKELFSGCRPGRFPLAPLLRRAMNAGEVSGEYYPGTWFDIGTPQRLAEIDRLLTGGGTPSTLP